MAKSNMSDHSHESEQEREACKTSRDVEKYEVQEHHQHSNDFDAEKQEPNHHDHENTHDCPPSTTARITSILSRFRTSDSLPLTPPPDGGLQAWLMVFTAFLVNLNTWGFANTFGVFQTYYVNTLHIGANSAVSWIGSLHIFFVFAIGTFSGRATDAGYFRLVFTAGSILYCIGLLLLSFCTEYWQVFCCHSLIVGIGAGMTFVPGITVMASYFSHAKRPIALAFVVCGSSVGGVLFPVVAERMLPRSGFGWTVRVIFFIQVVVAAICCFIMKSRTPPRRAGPLVEWSAWKEAPYTLYLIGIFFTFLATYIAFFYVGSFGRDVLGVSSSASIQLLLVLNAVGLVGRLVPGFVAEKFTGPLNLIVPYTVAAAACFFSWIAVRSVGGLYAWDVVNGLISAGLQGLFPVVLTSLTDDPKKMGVRSGMGFTMAGFAILIGPPIAGALVERLHGDYLGAQIFAGCSLSLAVCFQVAARWARVGWDWRARL